MAFEDCTLTVKYYKNEGRSPNVSTTGVNVQLDCYSGTITLRKYPTGILITQEICKYAWPEAVCTFCMVDADVRESINAVRAKVADMKKARSDGV